ncbi:uncharacterized protein Z518_04982 [Rhinocladiella mackenziei CBS 650.93]|uniref:U3 small nucleolar RNA-associated protein 4 n=1 Tax=Rhinocladiella mackenziei CBS 650.93 TaxID=1442369 RepID=A0A0D2IV44_9EURO|nr:uncharacterized protein Z518_04982 [Rhinocladiella mackenziei CBS 650.93]KIX07006.1 hypothetical protein Z518_04982 [Rhinocladiella mackenziei CBS 650.93]
MDIHRCRFVQYPPQPINALAFSHPSRPKERTPSDLRLALGRSDGDIEIWNPRDGLWVQETILKGKKDTTIEQLAWIQDRVVNDASDGLGPAHGSLRLFSTGGSNSITEWDICTGSPKRQAEGNSGDIWCFAAQPPIEEFEKKATLENGSGSQLLAAGCSNGTVILFSTEDDDLRYLRHIIAPPVKKPKVLSLTWRDRQTLVAGYEDSIIRVIDVPNRKIIRNMSLGKPVDGNNSVVWTVKCLPDGSILSGDSAGELKIWDSKNFALVQRLKSHKADILDIATSASGDMIFSFGVDRRTVTYKPVTVHPGIRASRWAEVTHKRFHRHDVKCSSSFESKDLSVLVSGGMDARPIVVPIRRHQTELHRTLPHLPQRSQISSSPISRLFISWWDREIQVYYVRKYRRPAETNFDNDAMTNSPYETLARLVMQGGENIQDANISEDGQFIVAATISSVKLFQLRETQVSGKPCIRTRQIELPHTIARLGARRVGFSPDGKWLYTIRKDNTITLTKITPSENPKERPSIHQKIVILCRTTRNLPPSALGTYQRTTTQIAFSTDCRVLAVGDLSGAIDVWVVEGHEDLNVVETASHHSDDTSDSSSSSSSDSDEDEDESPIIHGQKWIRNPSGSQMPQLDSAILALTFRPSPSTSSSGSMNGNLGLHATRRTPHPICHERPSPDIKLLAMTATHQLIEFDVLSSKLSEWSRRNPSKYLPYDFTRIKDRVMGCFWDCTDRETRGERLWLYGPTWLFMLDISQDLQVEESFTTAETETATKVERSGRLGRYDVLEPVKDNGREEDNAGATPSKRRKLQDKIQIRDRGADIRNNSKSRRKRKSNTGAGDAIPERHRESAMGSEMLKFKNPDDDVEMIDFDAPLNEHTSEVADDDDSQKDALTLMRRNADVALQGQSQGQDQNSTDKSLSSTAKPNARRPHWHTFAYRSILGIGVIGTSGSSSDTEDPSSSPVVSTENNIEVVIVERSMWNVDQLPRFDGGQEWET